MAITQDNRVLNISSTAFDKDFLLLQSFKAVEGVSELFTIEAKCLVEEDEYSGAAPSYIKPQSLLGKGVHIRVEKTDGKIRHFNGIVSRISQGSRSERFTDYTLVIRPAAWLLTQVRRSRIFQNKPTKLILDEVLKVPNFLNNVKNTSKVRNYCVQYRESDWDFASRLMEEDGIYYYFKHNAFAHQLVVSDDPNDHEYCPDQESIEFRSSVSDPEGHASSIGTWHVDHQLQTGKVTLWDHHFLNPFQRLESTQSTVHTELKNSTTLESYDYPGGYARLSDIKQSTADDGHLPYSRIRMEELDVRYMTITGTGDVCGMTPGHRFTLENHPNDEFNRAYMITRTVHESMQSPTYVSDEQVPTPYINSFACVTYGEGAVPFRPERKTPKPIVHGSQTAWVVGSKSGEAITTDEHGRVKVQFHWDREGDGDDTSSCWVRVAQSWAGRQFGTMFIPRNGMQVVVDFFEGDPDQPIITGCVHNADAKPAYELPKYKTRSYFKTNSVGYEAKGFNEIRFEDEKGKEQIFIHAQTNQDIRVKKDCKETIEQDRHLLIKRDQFEKVEKDKHLLVKGDHSEAVNGNIGIKAGVNMEIKTGTKFAVDSGTEVHIKAGATAVIEAGASLTLKVGGSFIAINSGGVFIKGPMVQLNSGGAAGSGGGSSPKTPKDALEADDDNAGKEGGIKPEAAPPAPPVKFEKMAAAAQERAANPAAPGVEGVIRQQIAQAVPQLPPADLERPVAAVVQENRQRLAVVYLSVEEADARAQEALRPPAPPRFPEAPLQSQAERDAVLSALDDAYRRGEEAKEEIERAQGIVAAYSEAIKDVGEDVKSLAEASELGVAYVTPVT